VKLFIDTLQSNGKWSQKRIMVFTSFFVASIYAFTPAFIEKFEVKEFVFLGFMGAGGFTLYRLQKKNENIPADDDTEKDT